MGISLSRELTGELQLIASIIFFGISFTGQRFAMIQDIGPLTYNTWRFFVSTGLLLVLRPYLQSIANSEYETIEDTSENKVEYHLEESSPESDANTATSELKELWFWGTVCGLSNYAGSVLQQIALVTVSVGKTGFITGMYVVVVPIVEWFIPGRSQYMTARSWVAAIVSVVGMYFLSGCASTSSCLEGDVGRGEILVLISVLAWVVSIIGADFGAKRVDCISLTAVDFVICTILNLATAWVFEYDQVVHPMRFTWLTWASIIVVGITEAAAFTLSTLGQMYTPASRAALLMSLETVSSALGGYLLLHETLSGFEILGCCIMFAATLISSIDLSSLWSTKEEAKPLITRRISLNRQRTRSESMTSTQVRYSILEREAVVDMGRITVKRHSAG
jgi:drug/metabolite transporter (DMT)-like permease